MEKRKQKVAPYIIRVYNSSGNVEVYNVVIFDIKNQLQYAGHGNSYGNNPSISITCLNPNVTYHQMLYEFLNNPFIVQSLYIIGEHPGKFYYSFPEIPIFMQQVVIPSMLISITQPLTHEKFNAKGISDAKTIVPMVDPYQKMQNVVYYNKDVFQLNADTRIIIPIVYAQSSILYYFYPKVNADISRALINTIDVEQKNITAEFEKEDIIKEQKVKMIQ